VGEDARKVEGGASAPPPALPVRLSGLGEERVQQPIPLNHVTILGMGTSGLDWITAGYDQHHRFYAEGSEVWTVNAAAFCYRHHRSFNIHDWTWEPHRRYLDIYKHHDIPVVTCRAIEDLSCTMEYPLHEVIQAYKSSYLVNSVAYAIAYAYLCFDLAGEPGKIDLFGCDYNYKIPGRENPYEHGRCNVEYWIGMGKVMGHTISVAPRSFLMDTMPRLTGKDDLFYGYGPCQPTLGILDSGAWRVEAFADSQATTAGIEFIEDSIEKEAQTITEGEKEAEDGG